MDAFRLAGDTIAIQTRTANGGYEESKKHCSDAPFHLPVVYQDDHFAIVNKPEGVVVFGHKNGGYGRNTVKSALPYVLDPPKLGEIINISLELIYFTTYFIANSNS